MADTEGIRREGVATGRDAPVLVLAGVGHAHLFVLEALARGKLPPVRPVLVAPSEEYYYSGMVSGVISGSYPADAPLLRTSRLARAAGAEWVQAAVRRVDENEKRVELDDGRSLPYDLLSLSIGSRLQTGGTEAGTERAVPIKPFNASIELGGRAAELVELTGPGRTARIAVVGGGAAGWEIALSLEARLSHGYAADRYRITLLHNGRSVLEEHPSAIGKKGARILRERNVEVRCGTRVTGVDGAEIFTATGDRLPFDLVVWATGPRAPALIADSGLPTDGRGYLLVSPTLMAKGSDSVFGAGDCIGIEGFPWVPKAGVYAVREGAILACNLMRRLKGEALEEYEPQSEWLSLMNTGDGKALLSYRGVALHGRAAWWLKDRIDRRFVQRFQVL